MSIALAPVQQTELSPEHAATIKATLPLVGSQINEITRVFYSTMFSKHPELLANTFNRGNQKQGTQQRALAASVATFATMLVDPDAPNPSQLLSRIGHKHASLGITADQYQIVHDNLFAAIVEVLGADVVTPEVAEAWDAVYWMMADCLVGLERELYASAEVEPGDVFRNAVVVDRQNLPGGTIRFTVESADSEQPLPGHQPGQYISVGASLPDGARQLRQYSLVGDGRPGRLTFAVKRAAADDEAPEGEVSNWLARTIGVGDMIEITLPFGDMVLDTEANEPVVLISAGIGATPMMGMLGWLAASDSKRRILALHSESTSDVDAMSSERQALVVDCTNASALTWYSELIEDSTDPHTLRGRMDLAGVELPEDADVYVCGSNAFLQSVRDQLRDKGVADERVHFELFAPNDWLLDG